MIQTGQRSVKFLLEQRLVSVEHQKWLTKLGFDFEIPYKPRSENCAGDALSRQPLTPSLNTLVAPLVFNTDELQQEVEFDKKLLKIKAKVIHSADSHPSFSVDQGRLLFEGHMLITHDSPFVSKLLKIYRDNTLQALRSGVVLVRDEGHYGLCAGLQGLPTAYERWTHPSRIVAAPANGGPSVGGYFDGREGLSKLEGFDCIFEVVDCLSKYGHFIPLKHPFTAIQVADTFIKEVVRLHGIP